jgi:hypothetical protein
LAHLFLFFAFTAVGPVRLSFRSDRLDFQHHLPSTVSRVCFPEHLAADRAVGHDLASVGQERIDLDQMLAEGLQNRDLARFAFRGYKSRRPVTNYRFASSHGALGIKKALACISKSDRSS